MHQKEKKVSRTFAIVPFSKAPYYQKPFRWKGHWWSRKNYHQATLWEIKNTSTKSIYMEMDSLVAVFKEDLRKGDLSSILHEVD